MVEWILSKNPIRRLSRRGQSDEIKSEEIFRSLHGAEEGLGRGIFPPHFDIYTLVALLPYPAAYQPLAASCHRNSFSITRTSLPSIRDRMPEKYVPL